MPNVHYLPKTNKEEIAISLNYILMIKSVRTHYGKLWPFIFTAPMLGFFKTTITPVFAGIMSRIVGADEQGEYI